MPVLYLCRKAGCGNTVESRGYCEEHKHLDVPYLFQQNKEKVNHHAMYQTARWRELREKILKRHGKHCKMCGAEDRLVIDHIIDHRGNEESFYDEDNLQVLCSRCHGHKGASESARKSNR